MTGDSSREPARSPNDLERLLVSREWAGDIEGMLALYESDAVVDCGNSRILRGKAAIREYFADVVASGRKFQRGEQRPAVISGELALTSTRLLDGTVTAEVARRQTDGTWLWVLDRFSIAGPNG